MSVLAEPPPLLREPSDERPPWWSADARALAWLRSAVGLAAATKALLLAATLSESLRAGGPLPAVGGFGLSRWLPSSSLSILLLAMGAFGIVLLTGVNARISATVVASTSVLVLLFDGRAWSNHLLLLALLAAVVASSGGGRWRGSPVRVSTPAAVLACTQVSVVYVFSGLSKLTTDFLDGSVLATELSVGAMRVVVAALSPMTWIVVSAVAATGEVLLGLGLWSRRWRRPAAAAGLGFHVTIIVGMAPWPELLVFALLCVGTYPLFLTRARVAR